MAQNHNQPVKPQYECKKDFVACGDEAKRCIPKDHLCDGHFDCQNGSDEVTLSISHLIIFSINSSVKL